MRRLLLYIALALPFGAWSQVHLERQVISSGAVNGTGTFYLSSTLGQTAFTTASGSEHTLTQGFEQPALEELILNFDLVYDPCAEGGVIDITQIGGCGTLPVNVTANGIPFDPDTELLTPGEWEVLFYTQTGCSTLVNLIIEPEDLAPCELVFYNWLTPNDDEVNDDWIIDNLESSSFTDNSVLIYDRFGSEVWQGNGYDNSNVIWQGRDASGTLLPVGTYFFVFQSGDLRREGYIDLTW